MNNELLGLVLMFALMIGLAIPLGIYMSRVFSLKKTFADKIFNPVDKWFYRLGGIDPEREMNWKEHLIALVNINLVWLAMALFVLMNMSWLPLNPDSNPSMKADLAFHTAVSFITNTNLQHYSGETGLSYFGQLTLMLWQFISAACGIAIAIVVFRAMKPGTFKGLGNFYQIFVTTSTRILFPLASILAICLVLSGTPMTFAGKDTITTLQGDTVQVSRGPVAAFVAIKQLGTNGGGFFGPNSAHPFENPTYFTNILQTISIGLIPIAMIIAFGRMINRKKLSLVILGVMTTGFLLLLVPTILTELRGNPALQQMGINQQSGAMEGKEVRFGAVASAYWAIITTCTSNGSVNAMHDSLMPLSGMFALLGMMVNAFFGGVGVGFLNFYVYMILAVFISGLLVGRTPELLGRKVEAREMKVAMLVALLHPMLILAGTALSSYLFSSNPDAFAGWLNNPGYHGFSEMLYEFTSSSANNGSGFEGLGDNTPFWNISTGIIMLLARYLPIIGPVAIAGWLHQKKNIPETAGTLQTDTFTFGFMILTVIIILAALSFFPALALGPIAEHFTLYK